MPLKLFTRLLTILALLFAPAGMLSGHAAMAAPIADATAGHCADMAGSHGEAPDDAAPADNVDCRIACSCVPPTSAGLDESPAAAEGPAAPGLVSVGVGTNLAADPPPPRLS